MGHAPDNQQGSGYNLPKDFRPLFELVHQYCLNPQAGGLDVLRNVIKGYLELKELRGKGRQAASDYWVSASLPISHMPEIKFLRGLFLFEASENFSDMLECYRKTNLGFQGLDGTIKQLIMEGMKQRGTHQDWATLLYNQAQGRVQGSLLELRPVAYAQIMTLYDQKIFPH